MVIVSSISGLPIYAPSAAFAPTNSGDVSAIASAYQVVSATATQLNAGTAYVTSINETPLSAARAGNAANASLSNSAWYDGTGRLISALPDSAAVSAIASSYVESGVSSKQDTLSFAYNTADQISSINGSALGGMDEAAVSGIASAYAESAASSKADSSALSSYALSADVSGTIDTVSSNSASWAQVVTSLSGNANFYNQINSKNISATVSYKARLDENGNSISALYDTVSAQSANWGGSALALSAGPGVKLEKVGDTLVVSTEGAVIDEETVAGIWNGHTVYQMMISSTANMSGTSNIVLPSHISGNQVLYKWLDPSNSWVYYGTTAVVMPMSWYLGAGRQGSFFISENSVPSVISCRAIDQGQGTMSAYLNIKYVKTGA